MLRMSLLGLAGLLTALQSCGGDDSQQKQIDPCEQATAELHEIIDEVCAQRVDDCCFCYCWLPAWGGYDVNAWLNDCDCQCVPEPADPLDYYDECEGEQLASAEQCLDDIEDCADPVVDFFNLLCDDTSFEDCGSDTDTDTDTETDTETDTDTGTDTDPCPGYTGYDPCCTNDDPCDWELNDICDCDSTCAWDAVDCEW